LSFLVTPFSVDLSPIHSDSDSVNEQSQSRWWGCLPATKADVARLTAILNKILMTTQEVDAVLKKVDDATNKIAANVAIIATTDRTISDEIDKFLSANPPGTVLTDAQIAVLQGLGEKAQASSDASDAQVAVLQAIAAKGAGNPVPVPPPAPPAPYWRSISGPRR